MNDTPHVSGIARMNLAAMEDADVAILHNALAASVQHGETSAVPMLRAVEAELAARGFDTWAGFTPASRPATPAVPAAAAGPGTDGGDQA